MGYSIKSTICSKHYCLFFDQCLGRVDRVLILVKEGVTETIYKNIGNQKWNQVTSNFNPLMVICETRECVLVVNFSVNLISIVYGK